jgi:hypothetical protein
MSKFNLKSPVRTIVANVVQAIDASTSAGGTIARGAVALALRPDAEASEALKTLTAAVRDAGLTGAGYASNIKRVFRAHPDDLHAVWMACEAMPQWPSMHTLFRDYPEAFPTKGDGRGARAKATKPDTAAPSEGPMVPSSLADVLLVARGISAKISTLGMSAADTEKARDPLMQFIAVVEAAKKAAEKKNEAPM